MRNQTLILTVNNIHFVTFLYLDRILCFDTKSLSVRPDSNIDIYDWPPHRFDRKAYWNNDL